MSNQFAVVVMDNHNARIWKNGLDETSKKAVIHAHDPIPEHDARAGEPRGPEAIHTFLEEISNNLVEANAILLMGPGKGKASGANNLKKYLEDKHPGIANKIYEIVSADITRTSEKDLLARARIELHRYLQSH